MTDFLVMDLLVPRITSVAPTPVDEQHLVDRLRLTVVAGANFLLGVPALVLGILSIVSVPLGLVVVGLGLATAVVPATERLTALHRRISGGLLGEVIPAGYAETDDRGFLGRPLVWLRDPNRWRDFAFLAFSGTGGLALSGVPALLLVTPLVHLGGLIIDGGSIWVLLFLLSLLCPLLWWVVTPPLVRARATAERGILGHTRVEQLERRVEEVAQSRSETLDAGAAEVRRIERDLHDGAQAQITAVGMNVGLAETLLTSDPEAAARLLRDARETTVAALAGLRSVIRGIHPPALADLGLAGGVEALADALPMPVTFSSRLEGHPPAAVESAVYFAVSECLANVVKHADATRAWVLLSHDGGALRAEVGDDGRGGADPASQGLSGVRRRLSAFDGTMTLASPEGGPTVVNMEVPCALSSQRTRPSSASD